MSIESDIATALVSVAGGQVYPESAPQDALMPYVVYRSVSHKPLWTLQGYGGMTKHEFVFESWAITKNGALTLRDDVIAAITAAIVTLSTQYQVPYEGDTYEPITDTYMQPVQYSFWHS